MSDEEQPEEQPEELPEEEPEETQIEIEEPPSEHEPTIRDPTIREPTIREPTIRDPTIRDPTIRDPTIRDPTLRDPTLREATSTDNDEQASYRRPSIPRSDDNYQSARRKTNVNNMNVCQKIIISIVSALFVLILFISTCLAVNGQIKSEMAQFRKEFEAKHKFYDVVLGPKMTHEKVVQELEVLKTVMAAKDKKLENEITDIDDLEKARDTKLVDIKKNCMLQDDDDNHNEDQDFCCQLLNKDPNDPATNMQQFEHCLSLLLTVRYNMPEDEDEGDKSRRRRGPHCPRDRRTRIYLCCTKKPGPTHCDDFDERNHRGYCKLCYKEGVCRNACGVLPVGR